MRFKQRFSAAAMLFPVFLVAACKTSTPPAPVVAPVANQTGTTPSAQPAAPTQAPPSVSTQSASSGSSTAPVTSIPATNTPIHSDQGASLQANVPPATPQPAILRRTAPAGARVSVTITQELSARKSDVGDRFTGVLSSPVTTSNGDVVFPRGARVGGSVIAAKGRGRFKGQGTLGIEVSSISGQSVRTSPYVRAEKGKGKRTAGFIGGGAGGGALIGGLAGGGKGALIGGLIGAGAGTAGAALSGNKDIVIPSESVVTFRLTAPVTVERTR